MPYNFVLPEKDIKLLEEYVNSGLSALNNAENIENVLKKIIKQSGYNDRPFSISDVQLVALNELLVVTEVEYGKFVMSALGIKEVIPLKKLSYNEAIELIQHGNEKFRNKRLKMPTKTKSVEDILMADSVSKEQIIEVMYDALNRMQSYNGNTITHCLIEAIKSNDIAYEE